MSDKARDEVMKRRVETMASNVHHAVHAIDDDTHRSQTQMRIDDVYENAKGLKIQDSETFHQLVADVEEKAMRVRQVHDVHKATNKFVVDQHTDFIVSALKQLANDN